MSTPVLERSPDKLGQYRLTANRCQKTRVSHSAHEQSLELVQKEAKILREQYHAERVAVFGALLHESSFT